jgi:hypothetical protein
MMCECYLSCCFQRFPSTSQINLQPFTNKTEALGWDDLACMESVPIEHPKQATFELIGKLLSAIKPHHPQWVCDTLVAVWKFVNPLEIEILSSDKFLFTVPQHSHVEWILH